MPNASTNPDGVTVSSRTLADFAAAIFRAAGMPAAYAESEADMLVWANVRGIDSHGVLDARHRRDRAGRTVSIDQSRGRGLPDDFGDGVGNDVELVEGLAGK